MKKDELLMTLILAAVLMAGSAYQFYRGGDKTAEVILIKGDHTPFEALESSTPTAMPVQIDFQPSPLPTQQAVSFQPPLQNQPIAVLQWLNRASADDFQRISGIGEQTANNIITYRKENNGFRDIKQLSDVSGIGEKRVEDMIQYIQNQLRNPNSLPSSSQPDKTFQPTMKPETSSTNISINQVSMEQLQAVSGIGPQLARMIVEERGKHSNGFQNWNQLRAVSGVGDARLKLLQQHFTLE